MMSGSLRWGNVTECSAVPLPEGSSLPSMRGEEDGKEVEGKREEGPNNGEDGEEEGK